MPVSSTATVMLAEPSVMAQAPSALMADTSVLLGARRYHWPAAGVMVVWPSA